MQPYLSRPPLQPIQRQAGRSNVPGASAMGRHLYVPQRNGRIMRMHDFSGATSHADPRFSHTDTHIAHESTYQPHSFTAPKMRAPHRQFPLGPFIVAIIVGVAIFGAWAGFHFISTPDPVNAAPVVYSK